MAEVVPDHQATPVHPWRPHGAYWHKSTTSSNLMYSPSSCGELSSHLSCRSMWEEKKYLPSTFVPEWYLRNNCRRKKLLFLWCLAERVYMNTLCSDFLSAWVPSLSSSWGISGLTVCVSWWWSGCSGHSVCALNCLPYWNHRTWSFKARNVTVVCS